MLLMWGVANTHAAAASGQRAVLFSRLCVSLSSSANCPLPVHACGVFSPQVKLIQLPAVPPNTDVSSPTAQQELQLARE